MELFCFTKFRKIVFEKVIKRSTHSIYFSYVRLFAYLCPWVTATILICKGLCFTFIPSFQKDCIIHTNATRDKPLSINTS